MLAISGASWGLTGNSGTNPAGNFLGTTDNAPLSFKVNNQLAGKIDHLLFNTSWGFQSLNSNTIGNNNTAIGHNALFSNTEGEQNTANGSHTLYLNTTGSFNTANGYAALVNNLTGDRNTATGFGALLNNMTGYNNTSTGFGSLYWNTIGNFNTADGFESLNSNNNGDGNTATGYQSLANSSGSFNTALGYMAGASNASGQQNTYIGANASGPSGLTNATAIGYNAQVNQSNSLVLGNNASVGIGTSSPTAALEISSTTQGFLPPRMTNVQINAISSPSAGLIVYNSTLNLLCWFNGTSWNVMTNGDGQSCGTVSYGGKTYNSVIIGMQCWMTENLNIGTAILGDQDQTNNGAIEKYCSFNLSSNCDVYGGLYQWAEIVQYLNGATNTTSWNPVPMVNVQGICPTGWHIPTDAEWATLTAYLGGESVAGGKMKETGTTHWTSPNTGASNSSGFTGLPGGIRWDDPTGYFTKLFSDGVFWSASEYSAMATHSRKLYYASANLYSNNLTKVYGHSVRCLHD